MRDMYYGRRSLHVRGLLFCVVISLAYLVSLLSGVPLSLHFLMFFGLVLIKKENNIHFILTTI